MAQKKHFGSTRQVCFSNPSYGSEDVTGPGVRVPGATGRIIEEAGNKDQTNNYVLRLSAFSLSPAATAGAAGIRTAGDG